MQSLPAAARLRVDLDGDGKPDTVLLYERNTAVVIVVHFADAARKPESFHFAVDPGREDAVCALPVRLEIDPLGAKGANGFRVVDETCDSIHFFWNHKTQHLEWWRL